MEQPRPPAEGSVGHRQGVATPAFRRLWWAWMVSLCGDGIRALALPLYVAVQTRDPLAASAVTAAEVLPWLLLALPAGAVVDRSRPKQVLIITHVIRAVFSAGIVAAILSDVASVPLLCVFAFVLTAAEAFAYPASQVLMVDLAGPGELDRANARFFSVHTIGVNLVGPLAAGSLFIIHPAITFAVDGLTFVIAAVLIASLPGPVSASGAGGHRRRGGPGLASEVRAGIHLLLRSRGLLVLAGMVAGGTLAMSAVNAMLPLYAVQQLQMSPAVVSGLLIVMALGTLLANQVVPTLARRWSDGPVLVGSMALVGIGMCIVGGFAHPVAAWIGNVVLGIGIGGWNVLSAARRQRLTPPGAMGRVSGAYRVVAWGLMPIGAGVAGPIALMTSLGWVFVVAGVFVLGLLALLAVPLTRRVAEIPAPRQAPGESVPVRRRDTRSVRNS